MVSFTSVVFLMQSFVTLFFKLSKLSLVLFLATTNVIVLTAQQTLLSANHCFPWSWVIALVLNQSVGTSIWRRKTERPWCNEQNNTKSGRQKDRERNRNEDRKRCRERIEESEGGGGRCGKRMSKRAGKEEWGPYWAVAVECIYLSCGLSSESREWE